MVQLIADRSLSLKRVSCVFVLQFYPTRVPVANGRRRVARVHTACTASGSSGTLRPHRGAFSVNANGTSRVGAAV